MADWRHDDLQDDLAAHLRTDRRRMVWTNMNLGPAGSPRPDVYTLFKSFTQPRPTAYEVKVSLADFRRDVTSGKWQRYLEYAGGVVFAIPKGLITREDLPKGCGLIVRSDVAWRTTRGATLHPVTISIRVALKLLMVDSDRGPNREPRRVERWEEADRLRKALGEDVAFVVRDLRAARESVQRAKDQANDIITGARDNAKKMVRDEAEATALLREKISRALGLDGDPSLTALATDFEKVMDERLAMLAAEPEVKRLTDILDGIQGGIDRAGAGPAPARRYYWKRV